MVTTVLAILSVLFCFYLLVKEQKRLRNDFFDWLFMNVQAVGSGGAMYRGNRVTLQTEFTQYQAVLSFLLVTIKVPSRVFIIGHESGFATASLFTLISLLLGWWAIPLGPLYTVQAILKNMRGGTRRTIGDEFEQIRAAIPS